MVKEKLIRVCARVRIIKGENTLSVGSGTILNLSDVFYVFTAYHCIYGDHDEYLHNGIENIRIEIQKAFNIPVDIYGIKSVTSYNKDEDWALLEVDMSMNDYPPIMNLEKFRIDDVAQFRGFQKVVGDESRTFECVIKELPSKKEFKVTLDTIEDFSNDADNAKGLSGSGVFIINNNRLHLIGLLKSVKGYNAINNDILCCSIEVLKDKFPESFTIILNSDLDNLGADQFGNIGVSDSRNIMDKIKNVCPDMPKYRIDKYCVDIALGKAELASYDERQISAMKFRIFHECQDALMDFLENNTDEQLSVETIKYLIRIYTAKAKQIIETKSKTYNYPIQDEDILKKIVLELINECYLSFDKDGIYAY